MADKVLVTIEVDVWKNCEPAVRVEEIIRETNKCILLYRDVHPRGYYSSRFVENRQVTVQKTALGIRDVCPGHARALLLLPKQADVREDPDFKEAMKIMVNAVDTELARAARRLAAMQGGDTNLQRIRTATEDEIVDFIDEYGSNFEIERYCVPERVGCEELPDDAAAPCRDCIRRWLHEKPERRD